MNRSWWLAVGLVASAALASCGGKELIPADIQKMMASEPGRLALQTIEGHGGIWRWRQRTFTQFDFAILAVQRGMDTVVANRQRDTTITPRLDTLQHVRGRMTLDLVHGLAGVEGVSKSGPVAMGKSDDGAWIAFAGVPSVDPAAIRDADLVLRRALFDFSVPFNMLDTTLRMELAGEVPTIDTVIQKGKEPGTFDTTMTPYSLRKLRVEFASGAAPRPWYVLYIDARDGKIRRVLAPDGAGSGMEITVWSDVQNHFGLRVGGRRLSYPSDADGNPTGPFSTDERFYNLDFMRELPNPPFTWSAHSARPADNTAAAGSVP
jgi:hypothetical protein